MKKLVWPILIGLVSYILMGAILTFLYQPDISQKRRKSISVGEFYGDGTAHERAMRNTYIDTELMLVIYSEEINNNLRLAMNSFGNKSLIVLRKENSIVSEGMS